ncbi:MAG: hypothetical protein JWP28_3304 [Phenylobacterium sp.]|jgi:hypothetical protein|nr:hypothetical protein [Phenylobacterium sp.]MDB5462688.1 hypothetical protein [Phenylobacterium sp.]MDB5499273.1 hypothetical protein [Phenylobacterium sp.]
MSGFSASEAALEGFRITRENPRAFGAWVGVSFAISVLGAVVTVLMPPEVRHGLETLRADETPDMAKLVDALIAVAPILILGLAIQCIMAAAVYRLIFRHEDTRFGYLRLGADELRLMALTLIYILLFMALLVAVTLGAAIVAALAAFAGQGAAIFMGGVAELFSLGLVIFVLVRLSLAPVATFAERRLAIFESWRLTRGHFWRLFGAYALALACIVVVGFLALVVFTGVAGVILLMTGGQLSDLSSIFKPDETSIRTYFNPGLIAYMITGSVFSALYYAVIAAPGAVAYAQLHGHPPEQPLTAQTEAG